MMFHLDTFVHLVLIGFVALFPVVNPIGTAFIVSPYFTGLQRKDRLRIVKVITIYAFMVCAITLFVGHWILELFGLSIPIIQLAGGIMICKIGWEFLSSDNKPVEKKEILNDEELSAFASVKNKLFYPITFPMTTGAGTIAVLFTLSAHGANNEPLQYLFNVGALLVSVILICILIFILYLNTNRLLGYIGKQGEIIIDRIMAFLIFCVGLQIGADGIIHFIKSEFSLP